MDWFADTWVIRELIRPALDVLLLAFLIYRTYSLLAQTRAVQLVKGAFFIAFVYAIAFFMKLNTLLWILNLLVPGLVIGIAIIFQPELRRIVTRIGQGEWFKISSRAKTAHLESVLNSVEVLSVKKWGCLIVFMRQVGLKNIIESGTRLNAELSSSLILTIFTKGSSLHDGAIVIRENKVVSAGCFLPLSEQTDIRRSFGSRHRAALGLAEETDAVVLVVSEETGAISLAYDANLLYDLSIEEIESRLKLLLEMGEDEDEGKYFEE